MQQELERRPNQSQTDSKHGIWTHLVASTVTIHLSEEKQKQKGILTH